MAGMTRRHKGFEPAARLVGERVRQAGESRGFAVSRLLTHWADVVGPEIAALARTAGLDEGTAAALALAAAAEPTESAVARRANEARWESRAKSRRWAAWSESGPVAQAGDDAPQRPRGQVGVVGDRTGGGELALGDQVEIFSNG